MDKLLILSQKAYILFYEKKWIFEDNQQYIPIRKSVRLNTDASAAKKEEKKTTSTAAPVTEKKVVSRGGNKSVIKVANKTSKVKADEKQM